jgi:hypothetical protein
VLLGCIQGAAIAPQQSLLSHTATRSTTNHVSSSGGGKPSNDRKATAGSSGRTVQQHAQAAPHWQLAAGSWQRMQGSSEFKPGRSDYDTSALVNALTFNSTECSWAAERRARRSATAAASSVSAATLRHLGAEEDDKSRPSHGRMQHGHALWQQAASPGCKPGILLLQLLHLLQHTAQQLHNSAAITHRHSCLKAPQRPTRPAAHCCCTAHASIPPQYKGQGFPGDRDACLGERHPAAPYVQDR